MVTALATATAAALPAACSAPSPTVIATGSPSTVWQHLDNFPPADTVLLDISNNDAGFIIAGSAQAASSDCPDKRDARIWSSADGRTWRQRDIARDGNARVTALAGQLAVGQTGCGEQETVAWRSGPLDWIDLVIDGLEPADEIVDLAGIQSGPFVASGHGVDDESVMGIWSISFDGKAGIDWRRASDAPPSVRASTLSSLASNEGTVIGFDTTRDPYAWFSAGGDSWDDSDLRPEYGLLTTGSAIDDGGFMAAGRGCCGLPDQRFGVIVTSIDGAEWTTARPEHFAQPIEVILATERGLIAVGTETYLSPDGSDWWLGPPLPGYQDRVYVVNREPVPYRLKLAVVGQNMVAISPADAWVAALGDLAADRWPEQAPTADMPAVGEGYEATLPTHCGPFNGPLYFAGQSWIPDLPGGSFPLTFDYYYETGRLDYVATDRLEFTGAKGDVVVYRRSDDPPHAAPCH